MQVTVHASAASRKILEAKGFSADVQLQWAEKIEEAAGLTADLLIDMDFSEEALGYYDRFPLVLVNRVEGRSQDLKARNCVRFNGWPGFFEQGPVEVVLPAEFTPVEKILDGLGWTLIPVPDLPGMVSPRIVGMIINEAYFGLGEQISTKEEIDLAMKLGTNYPEGPFAWCERIGPSRVTALLKAMMKEDDRYIIAPALLAIPDA